MVRNKRTAAEDEVDGIACRGSASNRTIEDSGRFRGTDDNLPSREEQRNFESCNFEVAESSASILHLSLLRKRRFA